MSAAVRRGGALLRKLRALFPATGRTTLLDLGCGTGGMCIAASREYDNVVGLDVALRWLVMGRQRLSEERSDVPLVCANAESLPFRAEIFDSVVADAVIEHVRRPAMLRDEMLRVLKQGGAFFFSTNNRYSLLPEPHVRIWGFGLLPRRWMEPVAKRVRRTPYKTRLQSHRALVQLFHGRGEVLLPYFEPGELGPRYEKLRTTWATLQRLRPLRVLFRNVVPQYFVAGRKPGGVS